MLNVGSRFFRSLAQPQRSADPGPAPAETAAAPAADRLEVPRPRRPPPPPPGLGAPAADGATANAGAPRGAVPPMPADAPAAPASPRLPRPTRAQLIELERSLSCPVDLEPLTEAVMLDCGNAHRVNAASANAVRLGRHADGLCPCCRAPLRRAPVVDEAMRGAAEALEGAFPAGVEAAFAADPEAAAAAGMRLQEALGRPLVGLVDALPRPSFAAEGAAEPGADPDLAATLALVEQLRLADGAAAAPAAEAVDALALATPLAQATGADERGLAVIILYGAGAAGAPLLRQLAADADAEVRQAAAEALRALAG